VIRAAVCSLPWCPNPGLCGVYGCHATMAAPEPPPNDARILWGVVANARANSRRKHAPLWSLVSAATGLGSTASAGLCRRFRFDPDSLRRESDRPQ